MMIRDKKSALFYNKTYDQNAPILVEKDNKIGFVAPNTGRIIIEPKYTYAERFYGNYTLVKVKKRGDDYYRIIDKSNTKKLDFNTYVNYKYIKEYDLWLIDGILYDNNFLPFYDKDYFIEYLSHGLFLYINENKNESGIFDYKKNKLFKFKGINIFVDKNNISNNNIIVKLDNTYSLCDIKNKNILYKVKSNDYNMSLFDDNIIYLFSNNKDSKYIVFKNNKVIFETSDNIENIEIKNNYIILDYGYNYTKNKKKQRYYYYNIKTEELSKKEPKFKDNNDNEYGYEIVLKDNKEGLKKNGKVILDTVYDKIEFLQYDLYKYINHMYNKELVLLYKNSNVKLYNLKKNKTIKSFNINDNSYIKIIENTPYIKIKDTNENAVVFYNIITNKKGKFENYDSYYVDTNYILIKKGNSSIYYNSDFNRVYESKKRN